MEKIKPKNWVDIVGKWDFELSSTKSSIIKYSGSSLEFPMAHGLCLNEGRLSQGSISTIVNFPNKVTEARILFGYNSQQSKYFTAGIGGWKNGCTIQDFIPNMGWRGLKTAGSISNIKPCKDYKIDIKIYGNRIILFIDDVEILEHIVEEPLEGEQLGIFSVGNEEIIFKGYCFQPEKADTFVVMQFTEPFDSLYKEVIKPIVNEFNLEPFRVDDVSGPGIILQDIIKGIIESKIIIAEVTPPNPNVFYELGYAHAMRKPTILLAEKGHSLPFDIQNYRVIFYENSISGKKNVEENLKKHLKAILRRD